MLDNKVEDPEKTREAMVAIAMRRAMRFYQTRF